MKLSTKLACLSVLTVALLPEPAKAQAQIPAALLTRSAGIGAGCEPGRNSSVRTGPGETFYEADFGDPTSESRAAWLLVDSTRAVKRALVSWSPLTSDSQFVAYSVLVAQQQDGSLFGALQGMPMRREAGGASTDTSRSQATTVLDAAQTTFVVDFATWLVKELCSQAAPNAFR